MEQLWLELKNSLQDQKVQAQCHKVHVSAVWRILTPYRIDTNDTHHPKEFIATDYVRKTNYISEVNKRLYHCYQSNSSYVWMSRRHVTNHVTV